MNLKPNNIHRNGKHYHAIQEGAPSSRQKKGDMYHFFNQEGILHHKYTLWGKNMKKAFLFGITKITLMQFAINNKKKNGSLVHGKFITTRHWQNQPNVRSSR